MATSQTLTSISVAVLLTGPSRFSTVQAFARGLSGTEYAFYWSNEHAAYLFENRLLSIEEFNDLAPELLGGTEKRVLPVFARVVARHVAVPVADPTVPAVPATAPAAPEEPAPVKRPTAPTPAAKKPAAPPLGG